MPMKESEMFNSAFWGVLRYVVAAPLDFCFSTLARAFSPIAAWYSVTKRINKLPGRWSWLHTHDDDLDGGQHQLFWPNVTTESELWWQRTKWIFRNAGYGFSYEVTGTNVVNPVTVFQYGEWDTGSSNFCLRVDKNSFSFRAQWFYFKSKPNFLRVWLGWKLPWSYAEGSRAILVTHINPFRTFKGLNK